MMKRVMRCHDFRSGQGARRRAYREYGLGAGRRPGRKLVPALRVAARTAGTPKRGAGIGATRSRVPACGMRPWSRSLGCRCESRSLCAFGVRSPKGPLFRPATHPLAGMRPRRCARVPCMMACSCPAPGSHPIVNDWNLLNPARDFVGRLADMPDISCATLRGISRSGGNAHVFHYVRDSKSLPKLNFFATLVLTGKGKNTIMRALCQDRRSSIASSLRAPLSSCLETCPRRH